MANKQEMLRLVRRALSTLDDIVSRAQDIEGDAEDASEDIQSLSNDLEGYLKRLRREIESVKD